VLRLGNFNRSFAGGQASSLYRGTEARAEEGRCEESHHVHDIVDFPLRRNQYWDSKESMEMGCLVLVDGATSDAAALREEAAPKRELCRLLLLNVSCIDEFTTHGNSDILKHLNVR
jgi:hypothetical protein